MCRYRIASGGRRKDEMHNEKIGRVLEEYIYLREKGLELSVSKSKMLRFKKRRGGKESGMMIEGGKIEEIKEFKYYLGFVFQRNGGMETCKG